MVNRTFVKVTYFIFVCFLASNLIGSDHQNYFPPQFNDRSRLEKIEALIPKIDEWFKESAEKNHIPGFAYGILVDGKLVHSGAGGFIDIEKKIPATSQSMFRIASMTKSFTALAILRLRDENKLKLDDPVSLYIPEIKDQQLTSDSPAITIRDLLTHSAGFPTDDPWADRKLGDTKEELIDLLKRGLFFSNVTGLTFEYSNLGYALLGYIISKITSIPFEIYIEETVGIQDIFWDFTKVPQPTLALGYKWIDEHWKEEPLLLNGIFGAMGGIITSIEAFSHYAAIHQAAWPPRNEIESLPLKRSSIREMHLPWRFVALEIDPDQELIVTSGYGYGLSWLKDHRGRVFVGHAGGLPGFGSNWFIMPEYGIGVILFTNLTYAPAYKINFELLNKMIEAVDLQPCILPASKILETRKKELLLLLPNWENISSRKIFAENFFLDHPIDLLKKETAELFRTAGAIISISEIIAENQLHGYFIVKGEKSDLIIDFALSPDNPPLIQQLHIKEKSIF